jgi:hypothetical protein
LDDDQEFLNVKLPEKPEKCPRCTVSTTDAGPFCKCGFDLLYGTPKKQKSGTCTYCEHNGKLSAEHIYGDWLRRHYNKPTEVRKHSLKRTVTEKFFSNESLTAQILDSEAKVQPYSVAVFNVCKTCNNTWMSHIHKAAQPIVQKFADGFWPKLSSGEVFALSRWIVMVTINLECHGRVRTITKFQKDELKKGRMPPGFCISAGRMIDAKMGGTSFHRAFKVPIVVGDDHLAGQISHFCVENVVFASTSTLGDQTLQLLKFGHVPRQLLPRLIWPNCAPPSSKNKHRINTAILDKMMENMQSPYDHV